MVDTKFLPHFSKKSNGFTLIELMITVAILGILAAIALPSYSEYIMRGHRANARNALIQVAQWMERAATTTGTYPLTPTTATPTNPSQIPASLLDITAVEGGRYSIVATTSGAAAYTFTAIPVAGTQQATDVCGSLVLNHQNIRTTQNAANTAARTTVQMTQQSDQDCWNR